MAGLNEPIPSEGTTRAAMKAAYACVTWEYLEAHGDVVFPHRSVKRLDWVKVVAVLAILPSNRSAEPLPSIHETNESEAQIDRENIAAKGRSRSSPSTGAVTAARLGIQHSRRPDAVHNFRPLELFTPPVTIYHPVFARFRRLMAQEPTDLGPEELTRAQRFVVAANKIYQSEEQRISGLQDTFRWLHANILTKKTFEFRSQKLIPDGAVCIAKTPDDFDTVSVITEVKNEIGDGGCDPLAQAECDYVAIYSADEACRVREACCCPAFLIGIAGPYVIISGAVFTDKLIAHTLTDYISIIPRPEKPGRSPLDDTGYRVARLFRALKTCIKELDEYYSHLVQALTPPARPRDTSRMTGFVSSSGSGGIPRAPHMIGPHFTTFQSSEGEVVLEYKRRVVAGDVTKAVFLADARRGSEVTSVVVKFAHKYSEEGHRLLVEASQAPRLHYCRLEESVAMWVVVMDYVHGRAVQGVLTNPAHVASLRSAITTLHKHGLVFGDLRKPNVLLMVDRVVLIDFDWCGKEGEARYPSDILLLDSLDWHGRVERGQLIKKVHDAHLFHSLTNQALYVDTE
ncbi:hypothetical protein C8Q72DRAFT_206479 [Fomitopsis betulina]|nr:hypothetical protein C8Q72DRAFT_206479 [Fomitopsis betulina]